MLGLATLKELEQLEMLRHETNLKGAALIAAYRAKHANDAMQPAMFDAVKGGTIHPMFQLKK